MWSTLATPGIRPEPRAQAPAWLLQRDHSDLICVFGGASHRPPEEQDGSYGSLVIDHSSFWVLDLSAQVWCKSAADCP
eukprot:CAMPEP_0119482424 /NCGR_PEP_ID=MMETSP1344-20130328/10280_1 /TAXON_ID=236787 /ORGANISM="Florenciella parvula, Strain CCMP2471" /LENGTH=77 /DNA_ID=CAMNT_0007516815 /DNA_START=307 /DNA_END=536 /DNA_ORIENTATION=-